MTFEKSETLIISYSCAKDGSGNPFFRTGGGREKDWSEQPDPPQVELGPFCLSQLAGRAQIESELII